MELRQLRYLDAVARRRSFTQAALDLHIAQSALSQQVHRSGRTRIDPPRFRLADHAQTHPSAACT